MAGKASINVGGAYHDVQNAYANIGGVWRKIQNAFANIGGTWRAAYSAIKQLYTNGAQNVTWAQAGSQGQYAFSFEASDTYMWVGSSGAGTGMYTVGGVDVTGYKTIKFEAQQPAGSQCNFYVNCGYHSYNSYGTFERKVMSIDISDLTGVQTIAVGLNSDYYGNQGYIYVFNVWLE
jgi:hypothetical protein